MRGAQPVTPDELPLPVILDPHLKLPANCRLIENAIHGIGRKIVIRTIYREELRDHYAKISKGDPTGPAHGVDDIIFQSASPVDRTSIVCLNR